MLIHKMFKSPMLRCEYRNPDGTGRCPHQFGGNDEWIGKTVAELRRHADAAGWVRGNPAWIRQLHGPGRKVDLCPTCAEHPDVELSKRR